MSFITCGVSNKRHLNEFIGLPFRVYAGDPRWIPPLKSEVKRILNPLRNPYFLNADLKLFNTYNGNLIVARCAVISDRLHQQKFNTPNAFFGFFESINSSEAVRSLFGEIENYCRLRQIKFIEGPFNPNLYSEIGLLTDSCNSAPSFFQTYNPPYYEKLLRNEGFIVGKKLFTMGNQNLKEYLLKNYPQNLCTESKDMRIRSFNLKKKEKDLDSLREIYNDAFSDNWHFTQVSKAEYIFASKYLHFVTTPDMIKFVEYKGEPVGVVQFAFDINPLLKTLGGKFRPLKYPGLIRNRKRIKRALIFAVGIKKEFQHTKAYKLLQNAAVIIARQFDQLETTWMYEENFLAVKAAERFGMKPDKYFLILKKNL